MMRRIRTRARGVRRRGVAAVLGLSIVLGASGCEWNGLNSLPMPGAEGTDEGAYQVRIQMPNVTTLTQNSPVRVDDVAVGSVQGIEVQGWHALVTVSLNRDVVLPANAVASIGQTSLLGSNHVELGPPVETAAEGRLAEGDVIPLERAGAFPTTEQVLSSASMLLNGGGIAQVENITRELNSALVGREEQVRDLLPQMNELIANLDAQRDDIINAMEGLDRVGGQFARQRDVLAGAVEQLHPALTILADRRPEITTAITGLGELSTAAQRLIDSSGDNLKADLAELWPVLRTLADTGNSLTESLKHVPTFPFPMKYLDNVIKGDYANLFVTANLTGERLASGFLAGEPWSARLSGVEGILGTIAPESAGQQGNPLTAPMQPPPPGQPQPVVPGLPPLPGLPPIPGLTEPAPSAPRGGQR